MEKIKGGSNVVDSETPPGLDFMGMGRGGR